MGFLVMSLADGDVYGGVGWVYPPLGYQPEGAACRHVVAQVNLDIVIAGKPLELSAAEGIEIVAVEVADDRGYVGALIVCCFGNVVGRRDGGDGEFGRWYHEPLIGKDFGARGMVDDH